MCSSKITETIQRRTEKIIMAHKCLLQPTLSELNTKFMLDFKKTSEKWLNNHGETLQTIVTDRLPFYNTVKDISSCASTCHSSNFPSGSPVIVKKLSPFSILLWRCTKVMGSCVIVF